MTRSQARLTAAPPGRSTRQKRALAQILEASDQFRSAQDLYAELRAAGERVGLTTVYHQLKALADTGQLDVLRAADGEARYRLCGRPDAHHHHLVCRQCGHTVEVEAPEVEAWAERVATGMGFVDVTHTVELLGTCRACASPSTSRAAAAARR